MTEKVLIDKEKLNGLRRSLKDALDFIEGLGVREQNTPELSPKQKRINKYLEKIR